MRWNGSVTAGGSCAALQYDLFQCCISVTQKGNGGCDLHQTQVTFETNHSSQVLPKRCPAKTSESVNENKGSTRIFQNYWNTTKNRSIWKKFALLLWNNILVPKVTLSMSMKFTFISNRVQRNKMLTSYLCYTCIINFTNSWYSFFSFVFRKCTGGFAKILQTRKWSVSKLNCETFH